MHFILLIIPSWEVANHSETGTGPIPLTCSTHSQCMKLKTSKKFSFILPSFRPEGNWLNKTYDLLQQNYLMKDIRCFSNC